MTKIEALKAKQAQLAGSMTALTAAVEAENRNLTPEETATFDGYKAEYAQNKGEIARLEELAEIQAEQAKPQARVVQPTDMTHTAPPGVQPVYRSPATGGAPVAHNFANHGFTQG